MPDRVILIAAVTVDGYIARHNLEITNWSQDLKLFKDQTTFVQKLMDHKLLTIRAAENVIRIFPPLTVKKNEIDLAIKIIRKVCKKHKV